MLTAVSQSNRPSKGGAGNLNCSTLKPLLIHIPPRSATEATKVSTVWSLPEGGSGRESYQGPPLAQALTAPPHPHPGVQFYVWSHFALLVVELNAVNMH